MVMDEKKVNRHTHPILVKARKDAYMAGVRDGFRDGYQKGYEQKCEEIHRYYKIVIHALERKLEVISNG